MKKLLTSLFLILSLALPVVAQANNPLDASVGGSGGNGSEDSTSAIFASADSIKAGDSFQVAIKLSHPPKWHSYYHFDAIGISKAPSVTWSLPQGFTASDLVFPNPHAGDFFGKVSYNYEGVNYFTATITAPDNLKAGKVYTFTADVKWQLCKESCKDEEASLDFAIDGADKTVVNPAYAKELGDYEKNYIPETSLPEGWTASATEKDNQIIFTLKSDKPLPSNVSFFEYDGQVDAQKIIATKVEGNTLTIGSTRNQGNDFSDEPGPLLENLRATIHFEEVPEGQTRKTFFISTPLPQSSDAGAVQATSEGASKKQTAISLDGSEEKKFNLITVIPFALLAGLILNIMPCVFPVLGLKITGFAQQAGEDKSKIKWHGLIFGLGVLVSMWALAGALIILKTVGDDVGWGFQLQNPVVLAVILIVMFAMALNLFGVFEIGTSLTGVGGDLQMKKGYSGSFFSGLLTTLIATPCSAPIVAPVMGFATELDPLGSLFVFTLFALGIASPFIILSFMPSLIQKLPKPGPWMVTFKKFMAFPMLAAVIFFYGTFSSLTGKTGGLWLLYAFLAYAIALFIYGKWGVPYMQKKTRRTALLFTVLIIAGGTWMTTKAIHSKPPQIIGEKVITEDGFVWETWSSEKVAKLRSEGKTVYVDFTGDG